MNLDNNIFIQQLFMIYRNLLTLHQQDIFEAYYFNNLSLAEIAENLKISRQAVKDILDRCEKSLLNFEDNLQISSRNDKILERLKNQLSLKELLQIEKIIYKRK